MVKNQLVRRLLARLALSVYSVGARRLETDSNRHYRRGLLFFVNIMVILLYCQRRETEPERLINPQNIKRLAMDFNSNDEQERLHAGIRKSDSHETGVLFLPSATASMRSPERFVKASACGNDSRLIPKSTVPDALVTSAAVDGSWTSGAPNLCCTQLPGGFTPSCAKTRADRQPGFPRHPVSRCGTSDYRTGRGS